MTENQTEQKKLELLKLQQPLEPIDYPVYNVHNFFGIHKDVKG